MKKVYSLLMVGALLFAFVGNTFAYTPTTEDAELLTSVEQRVDEIAQDDPHNLTIIAGNIEQIIDRVPEDSRAGYIIGELYRHIMTSLGQTNVHDLVEALFTIDTQDEEWDEEDEDWDEDEEDEDAWDEEVFGIDADRDAIDEIFEAHEEEMEDLFDVLEGEIEDGTDTTQTKAALITIVEDMYIALLPHATTDGKEILAFEKDDYIDYIENFEEYEDMDEDEFEDRFEDEDEDEDDDDDD